MSSLLHHGRPVWPDFESFFSDIDRRLKQFSKRQSPESLVQRFDTTHEPRHQYGSAGRCAVGGNRHWVVFSEYGDIPGIDPLHGSARRVEIHAADLPRIAGCAPDVQGHLGQRNGDACIRCSSALLEGFDSGVDGHRAGSRCNQPVHACGLDNGVAA